MLGTLRAARGDQSYDKKLLRYTTPDLLVIDDLGLRPLEGDEPIDLYEVMTTALLDRLLHRCHVFNIKGRSYRLRDLEGRMV